MARGVSARWERWWYPSSPETPWARIALAPLAVPSWVFRAGVGVRNALYDSGALASERVEGARIVSVGNLTVGGAGKTPAVICLAQLLASTGRKVAILSRGHGRSSAAEVRVQWNPPTPLSVSGDEPLLIARRCPEATVLVGANRARLAKRARAEDGAEVIILDDGMQYRRLARDIDIAVVDQSVGFGNGRMLPWGPLREPTHALRRASLLWLRSGEGCHALADFPAVPVVRTRYFPGALLSPLFEQKNPTFLANRAVFAMAGIARPASFLRTLASLDMNVVGSRFFSDHHSFTQGELDHLLREARGLGAEHIVTTEKDQVRLPRGYPAWTVRLDVEILEGREMLLRKLGVL